MSICKGHTYRVVVSDLKRGRLIWFDGEDRSEASLRRLFEEIGLKKAKKIRFAVMDIWKPFRNVTQQQAPQAPILFDKFHMLRHLNEAMNQVHKNEYARLTSKERKFIKGQKYALLSHLESLELDIGKALKTQLAANKRLNTAYLIKESFGQIWSYKNEKSARKFFDKWTASLKWKSLKPFEKFAQMIDNHWDDIAM
ncbi:MAG: transposase [Pseudomonadota bacterium]